MEGNISYNLRRGCDSQLPIVRTTSFGIESIAYLGNKLWQLLPLEIKQPNTLPIFKNELDAGEVVNATAGSARHIFLNWGSQQDRCFYRVIFLYLYPLYISFLQLCFIYL